MNGNIKVVCDNCKNEIRTEVNFPKEKQGFTSKTIICFVCGEQIQVFDKHDYNEDGTIN